MNYNTEKIILINHWNSNLFSFKCTRNLNFNFINGEFTLVGILFNNKPLTRAYSIVSSNNDDYLEFLSIKVINGSLTSKLKLLKKNDEVLISQKSTGTLLVQNLLPGDNLWLISSGTGIAPFISILNDFNLYYNYKNIFLVHSVKVKNDLVYRYYILHKLIKNIFDYKKNLYYYPILTKENFFNQGRITESINNKSFFENLNFNSFSLEKDRFMICGSVKMLEDIIKILKLNNFVEGKTEKKGHYLIERAFIN